MTCLRPTQLCGGGQRSDNYSIFYFWSTPNYAGVVLQSENQSIFYLWSTPLLNEPS
ncbi:hypothetical protein [Globicatella sanguinis]